MKKLFIPLLALLLAFSCIACGQDTTQDPTDTPAIQPQPSETVSQPVETPPAEPSEVPSEAPIPGVGAENEISADRLAELSALFGLQPERGNWYNHALAGASLDEYYTSPAEMNLFWLFYDGDPTAKVTEEERAYLASLPNGDFLLSLDISKVTTAKMNEVLQTYFGITLEETQGIGLDSFHYYKPTDSYLNSHGDTAAGIYTFVSGVELDNGDVTLYYDGFGIHYPDPTYYAVTLHLSEEGVWQIVSNLPVTE